jgi:DNA-binding NarL/FixJ family response regulator
MTIRLVLVDDHVVVRTGLRMLLEGIKDVEIEGEAGTAREALDVVRRINPDVVLLDIGLPDMSGIDAAREMKSLNPKIAIVALTIHEDEEYFFKMLEAGASGYVRSGPPRRSC